MRLSSGCEGDDFYAIIGFDFGSWEVSWKDGLAVDFRYDGFIRETQ
jgi:hypothetical protein